MKKFILKILIYGALLCSVIYVLLIVAVDGYTDSFYLRFTTPKSHNLILGTSKAAQGIRPDVLEQELGESFLNYSFTISKSPYGSIYLNSIKKKLDKTNNKEGVFILTVDPWAISSFYKFKEDTTKLRDRGFLDEIIFTNTNPNFLYFLNNYSKKYYNILKAPSKNDSVSYLHKDGWLEINKELDSSAFVERRKFKVERYKNVYAIKAHYSEFRFEYLKKTIQYLNNYGKVYLVRLPVHDDIYEIENEVMPNFDELIMELKPMVEFYYDMMPINKQFQYLDGNHLHKSSSKEVTRLIANKIKHKNNKDSL